MSVENGTNLTVEARVEVSNFSALGVPVVNVFVPTTEATFDVANRRLDFNWSSREVNVSVPGETAAAFSGLGPTTQHDLQ